MRKSRFTEEQIMGMIKEQEAGQPTTEVCRNYGVIPTTLFMLKASYGGLEVSDAQRRACGLVGVDPKMVRPERSPDHPEIREEMLEIAAQRRRFGYRRIGVMLERKGHVINHKKLYRLHCEEGLSVRRRRGRISAVCFASSHKLDARRCKTASKPPFPPNSCELAAFSEGKHS